MKIKNYILCGITTLSLSGQLIALTLEDIKQTFGEPIKVERFDGELSKLIYQHQIVYVRKDGAVAGIVEISQ